MLQILVYFVSGAWYTYVCCLCVLRIAYCVQILVPLYVFPAGNRMSLSPLEITFGI